MGLFQLVCTCCTVTHHNGAARYVQEAPCLQHAVQQDQDHPHAWTQDGCAVPSQVLPRTALRRLRCLAPGNPASAPYPVLAFEQAPKTVKRAYGGSRCGNCVRTRILRAFLAEEQRIVKKVQQQAKKKQKKRS